MPNPTLSNGEIWSAILANASLRPILDGVDLPGHGSQVPDSWLSDAPSEIKALFYGFRNRIKVSVGAGLQVTYEPYSIFVNATVQSFAGGSVVLPPSATSFVFVAQSGAIAVADALPLICNPLAIAITDSSAIPQLIDLRDKVVDSVRPIALPVSANPWSPGDRKASYSSIEEPGWMLCDGRSLLKVDYQSLFDAIGYTHGGLGANFNIPNTSGRTGVGSGAAAPGITARTVGQKGGLESVVLTTPQLASHAHGVNDAGHSHIGVDPGHSHPFSDPGHIHGVNDPGHNHPSRYKNTVVGPIGVEPANRNSPGAEMSTANGDRPTSRPVENAATGIQLQPAATGASILQSGTNISFRNSGTNISINAQGGNQAHENMMPFIVENYFIRVL